MRFNFIVFKRTCPSKHACHQHGMQPQTGFLLLEEEVLAPSSAPVFFHCMDMVCKVMESHYVDSICHRKSKKGKEVEPVEGRDGYMMLSCQV